MNHSRIVFGCIFAVSSLGFWTASYAEVGGGEVCQEAIYIWEDGCEPEGPREGQDNGWGNGDQDAPGNSGENNNAENYNGTYTDGTEGGTVTNSSGNTPPGQNK